MKRSWIFDIETDGFLQECTQLWLVVFEDVFSGEMLQFLPGDMGWMEVMDEAELLVGHNILGYDLPALTKLTGYRVPKSVRLHDTLTMSQVLDYNRFGTGHAARHSLERWGEYLGFPKIHFDQFHAYSEEMRVYCVRDVNLNKLIYLELRHELAELKQRAPLVPIYLRAEQAAARFAAEAALKGWPFDIEKAAALMGDLQTEMDKAYVALSARLGMKTVPKDRVKGIVDVKRPKWVKAGCYDSHTANWFGVDPWSGFEGEERMIEGEYCRVTFEPLSLDSVADVKIFLFRNGWIPLEWNMKRNEETRKLEKTSPKITEDSLEFLGGDGKLYVDFLTAKSRFGILKTWIENTDDDGNLHGDCMVIGTPSMRARHSIIVNVPSTDSAWGPEMRALFRSKPGWSVIGADSAGNQVRGLAHYLGDAEFIDILLNGDIHQYNADKMTEALKMMGIDYVVKRPQAKRILYAFLFGASGAKLWSYIFGAPDAKKGNKFKANFARAVPGFEALLKKLENIWGSTSKVGDGYIPSIAGIRVYVDSPHKLLVYLLQACEKATCSAAIMLTMEALEAENIPYQPLIFMHDEEQFMVPDEHVERAKVIAKLSFKQGPELFGIKIMDGDAKSGANWFDTH